MKNRFSFSEEAQKSIIGLYEEAIEKLNLESRIWIEKIQALCARTRYLPIIQVSNQCIVFYNEHVLRNIKYYFQRWLDSPSSLHAFIQRMEGGDDALGTARRLERNLEYIVIHRVTRPFEQISVPTETPNVSEVDYEILRQETMTYHNKIERIKRRYLSRIHREGEENTAFLTIQAVLTETVNYILGTLEAFIRKTELLRGNFKDQLNYNAQNAEEVNQSMSRVIEESAEAFRGLTGMFKL